MCATTSWPGAKMAESKDAVLIVRHPKIQTHFYDCVLDWVGEHLPECRRFFQVRDLPVQIQKEWRVRLAVMWLQDPLEIWTPQGYILAELLAESYHRQGIPVINRPSISSMLRKSVAGPMISSAGFHVARMAPITLPTAFREDFGGLEFPFFVRDDRRHGSPMLLAHSPEEARGLPLESFAFPVAVEFINVAHPRDGLFRKYRYFACGDIGVPQHLQISSSWIVRGEQRIANAQTKSEELEYISEPDPHHGRFQTARRALGLDMAAFDYSYDLEGKVVVWEVNSFPHIKFGVSTTTYRNRAIHRSIAAMVAMYLRRAGLKVPERLEAWLEFGEPPTGPPA